MKNLYKMSVQSRKFTSSNKDSLPNRNDQDELIEEITDLEQRAGEMDYRIETLNEQIREDDSRSQSPPRTDVDLPTRLSEREEAKNNFMRDFDGYIDNARDVNNDVREQHSLKTESLLESARWDKETLRYVRSNVFPWNANRYEINDLIKEAKSQEKEAGKLLDRWHENDINFPRASEQLESSDAPQNSSELPASSETQRIPQDSSDVEQTDFNSFDPFDE